MPVCHDTLQLVRAICPCSSMTSIFQRRRCSFELVCLTDALRHVMLSETTPCRLTFLNAPGCLAGLVSSMCLVPCRTFLNVPGALQDFLGFAPSRQAVAVVQGFVHAQAAQRQQWALSRLQHAAALTARRCAAAPLYGRDLRKVCLFLNVPPVVQRGDPAMHTEHLCCLEHPGGKVCLFFHVPPRTGCPV